MTAKNASSVRRSHQDVGYVVGPSVHIYISVGIVLRRVHEEIIT